jgi:hypothetical protein
MLTSQCVVSIMMTDPASIIVKSANLTGRCLVMTPEILKPFRA